MLITATKYSVAQSGTKAGKPVSKTVDGSKGSIGRSTRVKSAAIKTDTINPTGKSIIPDTTIAFHPDSSAKTANEGFLDDKVNYKAADSTVADLKNKKAYLFNQAEVYYQDMTLKAGYIEIDFGKKLVVAKGVLDSTGKIVQRPVFEQGPEKFTAGQITYNFETKKGKIKDVITQQGEGYIHGTDIKKDTNNIYYVAEGKYTTCDLEEDPHFYFLAKKIKVIPNDKIVCGPAELYIADVPTPLMMPFGYFPNKKGRKSGIIIPGYGRSDRLGYFLSKGGFYYGGSELFDALITGDAYSNGGFTLYETSSYVKRYKFDGNIRLTYSHLYLATSNPELANQPKRNDIQIGWTHNQDSKANPGSKFSASVDYATPTFGKNNGSVTNEYIKTEYNSRLTYSKIFTGTPFAMYLSGSLNQNVATRLVNITLPSVSMAMNRIYPFKSSTRIGKRWYDQIGIGANLSANNSLMTTDTLLFKPGALKKMQSSAILNVPIQTSFTVLKYITVTPSITANSYLHFKKYIKRYDEDTKQVITDTINQVNLYTDAILNATFNTNVYGDYFFKTKHLKQIHQVLSPSISFGYKPDYSEKQFGSYGRYTDSTGKEIKYPYFSGSGPSAVKSESINFGLSSTLEAKIKKNSDSGDVFKKVKLLESIGASLSYNAAALKNKWSALGVNARARLFNKVDVNTSATYDLYHHENGRITDSLQLRYGYLATLQNVNVSISTNLRSKEKKKAETPPTPSPASPPPVPLSDNSRLEDQLNYLISHPTTYVDFNVPWDLFLSYNMYYNLASKGHEITQTFQYSGSLTLTQKWKINFSSGIDLKTFKPTTTSIGILRDLHCWQMNFNWVPFGYRQTFLLTINVKSSMLKDLQLKKQNQGNQAVGY